MGAPIPCPFCGETPLVNPVNPKEQGDAWGEVRCINKYCPAQPVVEDGEMVKDNRGSDAYKAIAIARWNRRFPDL